MPVNAIAMPFSFAAAIDSSSLIDPPRLETGVRLAICGSLSLGTVELSNDLGAAALESQNARVAACNQSGLATRAKLVYFSLDSDACFIDAGLTPVLVSF
jgi:hypothetical protein